MATSIYDLVLVRTELFVKRKMILFNFYFQKLDQGDSHLIIDFILLIYVLGFLFIFCYFSTHTSEQITLISEIVYNDISWYRLPENLSRKTYLIILRSQRPVNFKGLNVLNCTLEAFANVSDQLVSLKN